MGDEERDALAEALRGAWLRGVPFVVNEAEGSATRMDFARYADALLPVVDAIARRLAAAELREAAAELHQSAWMPEDVLPFLNARADALDSQ